MVRLHWQDCIGALDGTHVPCHPPPGDKAPFFGRKWCHTQNILAVCDWNLCFTYVSLGWEGSVHDARILAHCISTPQLRFLHPQQGIVITNCIILVIGLFYGSENLVLT